MTALLSRIEGYPRCGLISRRPDQSNASLLSSASGTFRRSPENAQFFKRLVEESAEIRKGDLGLPFVTDKDCKLDEPHAKMLATASRLLGGARPQSVRAFRNGSASAMTQVQPGDRAAISTARSRGLACGRTDPSDTLRTLFVERRQRCQRLLRTAGCKSNVRNGSLAGVGCGH
jgi:hypothetical protein